MGSMICYYFTGASILQPSYLELYQLQGIRQWQGAFPGVCRSFAHGVDFRWNRRVQIDGAEKLTSTKMQRTENECNFGPRHLRRGPSMVPYLGTVSSKANKVCGRRKKLLCLYRATHTHLGRRLKRPLHHLHSIELSLLI